MAEAGGILAALTARSDAAKAQEMRRYHKTTREVLGVANPVIDAAVKDWKAGRNWQAVLDEARALWRSEVFEARIAAAKLLTKARMPEGDADVWRELVGWVPEFDGWAIADHASKALERRIMSELARLDEVAAWTGADHLWTKRAALVSTLPLAKLPHPKAAEQAARTRVLGWAADYTTDHQWFIQKAVGWWLRTLSKHDPDAVRAFIDAHGDAMKPFAVREALRQLATVKPDGA
ncbi:DNA alkylation repair protein [Algicella marina]|uniref:DNA alkylation repair protein n=1 Tax=Algicella marina TaxID=2683284 RepID=A0A6P1T445_9RHOB|nr:DNA alkylation repair protein [Algicella marina]QHQ35302.1 DNA alkylation repair protein [Algicella marina]